MSFLQKEISYLGYIISSKSVKMDPKKTEAITNLLPPKTEKQLDLGRLPNHCINYLEKMWFLTGMINVKGHLGN